MCCVCACVFCVSTHTFVLCMKGAFVQYLFLLTVVECSVRVQWEELSWDACESDHAV